MDPQATMRAFNDADLESMPAEVMDVICDTGGLSFRDNMNLRLTSRAIRRSTWEWFRRHTVKMPHGSDGTPNTLHVSMTPAGLDGFRWWTIHQKNTQEIKTIHINVAQFNAGCLEKLRQDLDNILKYDGLATPSVTFSPRLTGKVRQRVSHFYMKTALIAHRSKGLDSSDPMRHSHIFGSIKDLIHLRYLKYHMEHAEQVRMKSAGEESMLFNEAFNSLTELEAMAIGSWNIPNLYDDMQMTERVMADHPKAFKFKDDVPAHKRLLTSDRPQLPHIPGYGTMLRTDTLKRVFNLMAGNPKQLKSLIVQNNSVSLDPMCAFKQPTDEEAGIWAFCLPQSTLESLKPTLANLRKIHLTLSNGEYNAGPVGYTAKQDTDAFVRFLSALPNLQTFQLAAASETLFTDDFIFPVLNALPPTVTTIHLYDFIASVPTLCGFLTKHSETLLDVRFTRAYLVKASWTPVFETMAENLTALTHFCFERLWELHPEYADKVFFDEERDTHEDVFGERTYYVLDHADLEAGRFDQRGNWVFEDRYDALTGDGSDMPIEDKLGIAIDSERETWPYKFLDRKLINHVCKVFGKREGDFKVPKPFDP
ncbi:uncharacterized protein BKCO1_5000149 [Diplodia corticola]|uniref:Uncharacterized protein n=1 Tax=Diplodia corticola TaxID=236234 RepID=A0A1J9RZ85_9PEZI|nr:uncharacterized protein BKCO1_5000149 [Diplodia corticola]OJD37987.1 hypothetical protein BKCO1_5000149 [Diplodia corticola]